MKENVLKSFWRDTYRTSSPIPFIITGQVLIFILIHIFDLLDFAEITEGNLFAWTIKHFSLPISFTDFLSQPWSLFTHPFIYEGLFDIIFDCLWLYWFGNMLLNFLKNRHFLFVFFSGVALGALAYLGLGSIPFLANEPYNHLNTNSMGLAALISATTVLLPTYEVRLFLVGNIRLRLVAIIYLSIEFAFYAFSNRPAAVSYLIMILFGFFFMTALKKGNDWSKIITKKSSRRSLKVVHTRTSAPFLGKKNTSDLPNQELIDQILDKISLNGYESLTSREKEILFKASKQDK